jgi:hypothetical protein
VLTAVFNTGGFFLLLFQDHYRRWLLLVVYVYLSISTYLAIKLPLTIEHHPNSILVAYSQGSCTFFYDFV